MVWNTKLISAFSLMIVCIIPQPVSAIWEYSLELEFKEPLKSVNVSPGCSGLAMFNGTLKVEVDYRMDIDLSTVMQGENTQNWVASVSPSHLELYSGNYSVPVILCVKAPLGASHKTSGKVEVEVIGIPWVAGGTTLHANQELTVNVAPYYALSVGASLPYKEIEPHTITTINLYLWNHGNVNIPNLTISVANRDELEGWHVVLPASSIELAENVVKHVPIEIETPREWTPWVDEVQKIEVNLHSGKGDLLASYPLYIRQRGTYIPGFDTILLLICFGILAVWLKRRKNVE